MTVILGFAILVLDIWTDVDINVGVLYIIVVFMCIRICDARGVIIVTLCCTVLTFAGWIISPGNTFGTTAIANRLLGLLAVGLTTFLGLRDRAAQIALQEAWMQLARVNRVATMGELTASIAHEIKQPITAMVTNANASLRWLAFQPPELEEVKEALREIVRNGARAGNVTDRIYGLVKKEPISTEALSVNEIISEVLLLAQNELTRNRILVETQLSVGLPSILGDRIQLQQVLLNLSLNAIESMRELTSGERELAITSANDSSNGVVVTVRDSGPGLRQDELPHLFDAFYTTKPRGMGMGLTISRSIVERHGGRLWATQNERSGATFHLWLPLGATAAPESNQV